MTPDSIAMSAGELQYVIELMVSIEREEPIERMETLNRDELFEIFVGFLHSPGGNEILEKVLTIIQARIEKLQDSLLEKKRLIISDKW
jgi:hypothetical protein